MRHASPHLRRLCATCLLLAFACAGPIAAAAATKAEIEQCEDTDLDGEDRLAACTAVIEDRSQPADVRSSAHANRGELYTEDEEYEKAVADFSAALSLSPRDPAVLTLRGNAYDGLGDADRALADYTAAIALEPGDAAPYYNRGTIYHERGEREKAAADYRKALAIDPTFTAAQEALAELEQK